MKPTVHIQDPIFGLGQMKTPILEVYHHISPYTVSLFSVFPYFFFFFFIPLPMAATAAILSFFKIRPHRWKDRPKSRWVQLGLFFPTPVFLFLENYGKSDFCTFCKKKVIFSINGQKYHSYAFFHEGGPRFSSSWVNLATF